MARLITASSRSDAYVLSGFVASEETRDMLEKNRYDFLDRLERFGGGRYVDRFDSRRKNIDMDKIARDVVMFNRKVKATMMDERIYALEEIIDVVTASRAMREVILSDPEINRSFRTGAISGWNYDRDTHGYQSSEDRHDNPYYRVTHTGMPVRNEDGEYVWSSYLNNDFGGLKLSYDEQRIALDSIEKAKYLISLGDEDPTSLNGDWL